MLLIWSWFREHESLMWALGVVSLVTFIGTLIAGPILIVRIPTNYFVNREHHRMEWSTRHVLGTLLVRTARNCLGGVLLVAGLLMLVMPGQGLVTILLAVTLIDFPGKLATERWLISRRPINRGINWLRWCAGRPPLQLPDKTHH